MKERTDMAKKTSKFLVGLFVSLGIIIGVVVIIWVGAGKYFEKGNLYISYFDESVQGLQRDSTVKFRGVEVGRVQDIRVAPDNRLIGVVMKINLKDDLTKTSTTQLKVAGITGLVYVELDRQKPGDAEKSPKFTFPSEYRVIPSRPSEVAKVLEGVNIVIEKFGQVDPKALMTQLQATAAEIEIFFKGEQMGAILKKVDKTLANFQDISARTDKIIASGRVEEILQEARDTVKETKLLAARLNEEIKELNLKGALGKTGSIAADLKSTTENLKQTSSTLEAFAERVYDRPSDLLFGKPPVKRWNE
ncbi:MAG: MCE family protein [Deltaproteobacteria bacterium]|nr:MAG: MCE family protein [Deltaproteobacteria bacterium]